MLRDEFVKFVIHGWYGTDICCGGKSRPFRTCMTWQYNNWDSYSDYSERFLTISDSANGKPLNFWGLHIL